MRKTITIMEGQGDVFHGKTKQVTVWQKIGILRRLLMDIRLLAVYIPIIIYSMPLYFSVIYL